jgi:hypothetical protein
VGGSMRIDDVVRIYRVARAQTRRIGTFWLLRQERRARAAARSELNQFTLARLAAIRDELGERGVAVPPVRQAGPRLGDQTRAKQTYT